MADPFIAEIRIFGFNFAPRNWAFCDGQLLPIAQNTALFSLLGTYFGGNGVSTFALPNLQGRAAMSHGQGPGLSPRFLGESGGAAAVTLTSAQLPSHTHAVNVASGAGGQADRANARGNVLGIPADATYAAGAQVAMGPTSVGFTGGGQPHNNMPPYLVMNFCIALQGVFPPRN
jgi:microcystin-dependent protein